MTPSDITRLSADMVRHAADIDAEWRRLWWSRVVDEFVTFAAIAGCLLAIVAVVLAGVSA